MIRAFLFATATHVFVVPSFLSTGRSSADRIRPNGPRVVSAGRTARRHWCVPRSRLSLSETPFCLRRWRLFDDDPLVRSPFWSVFNVPLTRCPGVGEHCSPAPDWGSEAVRRKTAETDCSRPFILGFSLPGLARGAGHRRKVKKLELRATE